jgi:hypothetical protein
VVSWGMEDVLGWRLEMVYISLVDVRGVRQGMVRLTRRWRSRRTGRYLERRRLRQSSGQGPRDYGGAYWDYSCSVEWVTIISIDKRMQLR